MNLCKIVVIGSSHHNTLGIVRSLGEAGFSPDVVVCTENPKHEFVSRSRYATNTHIMSACDKRIIEWLQAQYIQEKDPVVLLPSSDAVSTLLDENADILKNVIFPRCMAAPFTLSNCLKKDVMNRLAEKGGLTVPKSVVVSPGEKYEWIYGFPCIIKPIESAKGNKKDITICQNSTSLSECLIYYGHQQVKALVQEYIVPEVEISTMGVSFDPNEDCRLPDVIIKKRFSNKSATYAEVLPIEQKSDFLPVADLIKKMIKTIGYTGIFDLDFLYANGRYYFIELNLRNGAYGYGFTQGGINFPGDWCRYQIEHVVPQEYVQKPIMIMNEFSDFKIVCRQRESLVNWLRQYAGAEHLILQMRDWHPAIFYIRGKI